MDEKNAKYVVLRHNGRRHPHITILIAIARQGQSLSELIKKNRATPYQD
jgi:hypothetical protein